MLDHAQSAFYEQALRPVPQKNLSLVERDLRSVLDNGARYEFNRKRD